jgi:MFS family permease
MPAVTNSAPGASRASRASQIIAATIGNALEWYDFLIFGYLTAIVSRLFFPSANEVCSLLAATATFGVGFFMRPVGGILLGTYADRHGRKAALQLIIVLSTIAMAMMAFAPTYAAFGIGAPLIILLARLVQGFATGGEFASSTAFLVECASENRRGLYGSWQSFGQALAMISGTAMGALITSHLPPAALDAWGWRIPFFVGLLICPVGFWIRRYLDEPEIYVRAHRTDHTRSPLKEVLAHHRKALFVCGALIASGTTSVYILNVYMPTFATKQLHLPLNQAFTAQCIAGIAVCLLTPLFGALSDRIGRKPILIGSLLAFLLLLYPMFSLVLSKPSIPNFMWMLVALGSARAGYAGVVSVILAEQFPTVVRSTGMSVAYNVAVMCFGGPAQFVVTWLIQATGTAMSAAIYLMVATVMGLVAAFFVLEPMRLESRVIEEVPEFALAGRR